MDRPVFSVTELNEHIRSLLDADALLQNVCVRGELSNYKIYPSGHHYFTLKDSESSLRCVMFRSNASRLRFRPENGMGVTVFGRIAVYPRDGAYQLYATAILPEGTGDLQVAFEQLKQKLAEEGLFDESHKKPLPSFPERIAIITSSAGAAVHDMIRILGKRFPMTKVLLLPVRVQGAEAPAEIAGAIRYANEFDVADVIITGRGGGSLEDLWAFNDERVARAIYASHIPVISAVGHEPDVTISDYVADRRASTPSNAAEIAVPDWHDVQDVLQNYSIRSRQGMEKSLKALSQRLDALKTRLSQWSAEHQKVLRQFVSEAENVTLDGNGRFLISKRLLQTASIQQDICFIGMDDTIEIWAGGHVEDTFKDEEKFGAELEEIMSTDI
jgi:exodeoxyribonuclease VII large subunit